MAKVQIYGPKFFSVTIPAADTSAKISAVYSYKLVKQPNLAILTECTDIADVNFN